MSPPLKARVTKLRSETAELNEIVLTVLQSKPDTVVTEQNPPDDAPAGTFVQVCDEATQKVYDQIWTRLKK